MLNKWFTRARLDMQMQRMMSAKAPCAAVGLLALVLATQALAFVTFTVNSTADLIDKDIADGVCLTDANTCTLRAAVMQANVTAIDSLIQLPAGTYTLVRPALGANLADQGDLNLATPLSGNPKITIAGAGAVNTIISANGIDRVFDIGFSRLVAISGITVTQGSTARDGGGIWNGGTATLSDSIVSYNSALNSHQGGGIYNNGIMTLTRVTLDHNLVNGSGGAISNKFSLSVNQSTLSSNTASADGGGIWNGGELLMVGSTLNDNSAGGESGEGGAIFNEVSQSLSLDLCTVSSNHASSAGGIIVSSFGVLTLNHTTLSGNTGKYGGAIHVRPDAQVTLGNSTLSGNSAVFRGGGIYLFEANVDIVNSTLSGNTAGEGGAIFLLDNSQLTLSNSTLSSNSASNSGGGLFVDGSDATIVNSTIVYNGVGKSGGGIFSTAVNGQVSLVALYSSTIVGNQADADDDGFGDGAGVYNGSSFGIVNSVLAGNYLAGQPNYSDCFGTLGIYGSNRLGTGSGCTAAPGSPGYVGVIGSLNELGVLSNNGGPTKTIPIVAPSDMIDGALNCSLNSLGQPLTTDQRGAPRGPGVFCDIGAYEYGAVVSELQFKDGFE